MANLTATEMIPEVGQRVYIRFESCRVLCVVRDVKCSYGRPRLEVTPVAGDGGQWVELSRVLETVPAETTKKQAKQAQRDADELLVAGIALSI